MDGNMTGEERPWPLRALLLLVLGAAVGAAYGTLVKGPNGYGWTDSDLRFAGATFLLAGGIVFAFSLERLRWAWSLAFSLAAGLLIAAVTYRNGVGTWGAGEGWQVFSGVVGIVVAVPLFQTIRDSGRAELPYERVHAHCWTNIVLWFASCAFVAAAFLLGLLLSELFALVGFRLLRDLLHKDWFIWMLVGGAFGAAVGLLRERERVLGALQRVATAILSVLAPILAVGLVLFVLLLPFTGLRPLWENTRSTTPVLLSAVLAAFVLVNATIGNAAEEEPRARVLRWAAMALGAVMLPLGLIAAVSTLARIRQYGLTPDRLWACVFVGLALGAGLFYLAALIRRRAAWTAEARARNLALGIGVCAIATFLALPIVSFPAMSVRDQLARLESGRTPPEKLDWLALRFDYGTRGVEALRSLRAHRNPLVGRLAAQALARKERWGDAAEEIVEQAQSPRTIIVRPAPAEVPPALRDLILTKTGSDEAICKGAGECLLFWKPGSDTATVVMDGCAASVVGAAAQTAPAYHCRIDPHVLLLRGGRWVEAGSAEDTRLSPSRPARPRDDDLKQQERMLKEERAAIDRSDVAVREIRRRQLFVGGKPVGAVFE